MSVMTSIRATLATFSLGLSLLLIGLPLPGQQEQHQASSHRPLGSLDDYWTRHKTATIGLAIVEMTSGKTVLAQRENERLIPASVTKAFTTGYAWSILGPDHRFATELHTTQNGQLILVGSYDPSLGSPRVPDAVTSSSVIDQLTQAIADYANQTSLPSPLILGMATDPLAESIPGSWDWEDLGDYYGAGVHRLNWHDNLYLAEFLPGSALRLPTQLASLRPDPLWPLENQVLTGEPGTGDRTTFRFVLGQRKLTARGTIPSDSKSFTVQGTLPDPGATLIHAVYQSLSPELRNRVQLSPSPLPWPPSPPTKKPLLTIFSPPLHQLVHTIHLTSFNMHAEALLVATALHQKGFPDSFHPKAGTLDAFEEAVRLRREWLASQNLDPSSLRLRDGAGLSNSNRISPLETARYFQRQAQTAGGREWLQTLAVHGEEGDLTHRREPTGKVRGRIRAKTGLLTGTRTLAGWIPAASPEAGPSTDSPHGWAFAIFVQGSAIPWPQIDEDIDRFLGSLLPFLDKSPLAP